MTQTWARCRPVCPLNSVVSASRGCLSQEAAAAWVKRMHAGADYNATYAPFLDTLPALGDVLSPEMWPPGLVDELQSPELVSGQCLQIKNDGAQSRGPECTR